MHGPTQDLRTPFSLSPWVLRPATFVMRSSSHRIIRTAYTRHASFLSSVTETRQTTLRVMSEGSTEAFGVVALGSLGRGASIPQKIEDNANNFFRLQGTISCTVGVPGIVPHALGPPLERHMQRPFQTLLSVLKEAWVKTVFLCLSPAHVRLRCVYTQSASTMARSLVGT
jgi:hypothetical protein